MCSLHYSSNDAHASRPWSTVAAVAAHAMTAIRPLPACWEHVSNFLVHDDKRQLYSEARIALAEHVVCDFFLVEDSRWVAPWIGSGASQCAVSTLPLSHACVVASSGLWAPPHPLYPTTVHCG